MALMSIYRLYFKGCVDNISVPVHWTVGSVKLKIYFEISQHRKIKVLITKCSSPPRSAMAG